MALATTFNTPNVSGMLMTKANDSTPLLDAIFSRGSSFGEDIISTGMRRTKSLRFTTSSGYDVGLGTSPSISEMDSIVAPDSTLVVRDQDFNVCQIFQEAVRVTYLKQSTSGSMSGVNIAGQQNNAPNEFDFQVSAKLLLIKKQMSDMVINSTFTEAGAATAANKTRGLIEAIENKASYAGATIVLDDIDKAITAAIVGKGFEFEGGRIEMWCHPSMLKDINKIYTAQNGFNSPASRIEGGTAIISILTYFGYIDVYYDVKIPVNTFLLLNMGMLSIVGLDVPDKETGLFYEDLAKVGASDDGQLYGQMGLDYGAKWQHIVIAKAVAPARSGNTM